MKTYPKYKDSGVPWLGEVPEHWEIIRTKYILKEQDARSHDGREQLLSVSQYTGVSPKRNIDNSDVFDSRATSLVGYKLVQRNELVVNIMLAWNGSLGVSSCSGIVSPAYCVYKFSSAILPQYYHYLYRTELYKSVFKTYSSGVVESRLRLYSDKLGCIESIFPVLEEQQQISRYLDWKTAKIDRFIKARKKIIVLLKEQKQTIINEAVTKGINPNVKMKDSKVEWLGEIPEHWEVRRLKYCAVNKNIQTNRCTENETYLALENIEGWTGKISAPVEKIEFDSNVKKYKVGDILFAKLRPYLAKVALPDFNGVCVSEFLVLQPTKIISSTFFSVLLRSKKLIDLINSSTFGAKMPRADWAIIGSVFIPLPPNYEQRLIVKCIEKETARIDKTISRAEQQIKLVQEYRTRLVSDVVTGKIDVRSVKIPDFESVPADLEIQEDEEFKVEQEQEIAT